MNEEEMTAPRFLALLGLSARLKHSDGIDLAEVSEADRIVLEEAYEEAGYVVDHTVDGEGRLRMFLREDGGPKLRLGMD
jgi:hypothetical protein